MKKLLMIAYHFPPVKGSSGIQRTLKFCQYLPQYGWEPLVLTVSPRAYRNTSPEQLSEIPEGMVVKRAFALDSARHLAIGRFHSRLLALPDRWASWMLSGVPAGLNLIRQYRPDAIWSTYPIASAQMIGLALARISGLPWVADFRDPMTDPSHPSDPLVRRAYQWVERRALARCTKAVFTTHGTQALMRERYPEIAEERFAVIENGYDEENFVAAGAVSAPATNGVPLKLLHSGILYPSERDPRPFFAALAELKAQGAIDAANVNVVLRATSHDHYLRPLIDAAGVGDIVQLAPPIPYREALREMLSADGLLLFQAANCNHQIPAKLYEYLRAQRPIFALTDARGDTAATLQAAGIDTLADLDSKDAIMQALQRFLTLLRAGQAPLATTAEVARHSRQHRTQELAQLLDTIS